MTDDQYPYGYCWDEHPVGGPRCTLTPRHQGNHHDWYASTGFRDWPAGPPAPSPN